MSVLSFTTTAPGASADYVRYLYDQPLLTDRLGDPCFLDFQLAPVDSAFVKLTRGNYVTLTSVYDAIWFTGYVQNDPELEKLGTHIVAGVPTEVFGFKYEVSSDEYVLNLKPIGVLPPFLNKTQGYILKKLASLMAPTVTFDVTGIDDGLTIARYIPDQIKKFSDIVKEFCDSGNMRFAAQNHVLTFVQQDTTPATLTIDGNDEHFTSANLTVKRTNESIVNDAIVLGDVEPNNYMTEYFVGDGVTAQFPLISSVFGVDSTLLLDDDFSATTFDETKWAVFDEPAIFLQLLNGYVNVLGGAGDGSYDVHLDGLNEIPLEGMLRITHGEYDFVSASDGVICGLWPADVSGDLTGCFYGIKCTPNGAATILQPLINGVIDTTQTLTINYASRYILRTIYQMQSQNRFGQPYSYSDVNGVVHTVASPNKTDLADVQTFIAEIDPTTGNLLSRTTWYNTGIPLTIDQCYGSYVPVASNNLNLTFTDVTVSTPMQATLGLLQAFRPNYAYAVGIYVHPKAFNGDYYQVTTAGTSAAEPVWPVGTVGGTVISGGVTFTDIGVSPKFNPQIVGPNEIDLLDGLAPIGTITDANQGTTTRSSKLGSGQYNFGNPALHFFTDSVNLTTTIPWVGDLIKLTYRRAAVAMARAQDAVSIASEATAWNDDGLRSVVRGLSGDITPPPRTSTECLIAAQSIVNDLGRQRWDGTYKGTNLYSFTGQPISGTTLLFQNMPSSYPTSLVAEVIQEVRSKYVSTSPRDVFEYDLTFGSRDTLKKAVGQFTKQVDKFQQDTVEMPPAIDITTIATAFAPDVLAPTLESWDTNFNCNTNVAPPAGGGFEIRYTDAGWGTVDGKNLLQKGASQTFSTPRNFRGKVVFVRAFTAAGKYSQYAAGLHIALPLIPGPPSGTIDETIPTAPIITFIMPTDLQDVWGVEARTDVNNPNGLVPFPAVVLYHSDLTDTSFVTTFTDVNNLSLVMDYDLYCYNLLGEYSDAFVLTQINPYVQRDSVTGQNLLANAGFEKNLLTLALNTERLPTQVLIDDWFVHGVLV